MPDRIPFSDDADKVAAEKERNDFYANNPMWRATRKRFIKANPVCARCLPLVEAAVDVHHIIPRLTTPPASWYDADNLESLCKRCHARLRRDEH